MEKGREGASKGGKGGGVGASSALTSNQADKEREASEWELLRASAGPQIEEQGELASGATCMEATRQQADCTVGHRTPNSKILKEQQYYLENTPEISIFVPSYLLNQLVLAQAVVIKVVELRDISNFA